MIDISTGQLFIRDVYVTVHMETRAVCKRRSPFENCLKSEPVYKRLGNMKTGRTPGYGSMKTGRLRGYEQDYRANEACEE